MAGRWMRNEEEELTRGKEGKAGTTRRGTNDDVHKSEPRMREGRRRKAAEEREEERQRSTRGGTEREEKNTGERQHAHAAARPEARDSTDLCVRKVE